MGLGIGPPPDQNTNVEANAEEAGPSTPKGGSRNKTANKEGEHGTSGNDHLPQNDHRESDHPSSSASTSDKEGEGEDGGSHAQNGHERDDHQKSDHGDSSDSTQHVVGGVIVGKWSSLVSGHRW